ncbi:hypothetical protein FQZ97_841090 [compost metagenome]
MCAIGDQAVRLALMRLDLGAIDLEIDLAHVVARIVHPANEHAAPQFFRAAAGQRGDQNCIGILAFRGALIQLLAPVAGEAAQGLPLAGTLTALASRATLSGCLELAQNRPLLLQLSLDGHYLQLVHRSSRERGMQAFQALDKIGVQAVAKRCDALVVGCRTLGGRDDFGHSTFGVAGTLQQRSAELAIVFPGLATQAGKFIGRKHGLHLAPARFDQRNHLIRVDHGFRP